MNIQVKPQQQLLGQMLSSGGMGGNRQVVRKPAPQTSGGKLMRLRCRFRPLQDAYLVNDEITEKDSDVVFLCLDGRVRAHKIILASCSTFFASLFEGQLPGLMSNVLVPDIPVAIVRNILSLAYKDNMNLTPQEMKDASQYLKLFGFPSKLFSYDGNPLRQPASGVRTMPVNVPTNSGVGGSGGKVRINQMGMSKPVNIAPKVGPTGAITVTASSIYRDVKAAQQRQQLAAAAQRQRVEAAEAEEMEYKFQLQGYDQPQIVQQKVFQQRAANPQQIRKPGGDVLRITAGSQQGQGQQQRKVFSVSNLRRIAPKPMPGPEQQEDMQDMQVHMETEDTGEEESCIDSEQGRRLIQEWMRNVGRDDSSQTATAAGDGSSDGNEPQKNQCSICNIVFDNAERWKWHESHHVGLGLFKCAYCDELFSTSRKVYQHEMMEHGVTSGAGAADSPTIPSDFKIVQGRKRKPVEDEYAIVNQAGLEGDNGDTPKMTLVRTIHGSHYRRLPGTAGPVIARTKKYLAAASGSPQLQQKYAKYASLAKNFKARNPLIGIAKTEAEDLMEARKVKQLHWLYVCSKCEHAADSSAKAEAHYNRCYPDGAGTTFESCVVKYRQGFFGKYKCPLCPKRYTSIGGFTIHCGHIHSDYRRKFAHRHEDDTISCVICKKKWPDPSEFHAHLSDDGECTGTPVFDVQDGSYSSAEWIGNGTPGEDAPPKPSRVNLGTLSRSTRLANRILTTAQDETTFQAVDCPICGTPQIQKIVDHIQSEHADLNVNVLRVADTTLRCQKCQLSFALSDLLSHQTSCTGSKEFNFTKAGGGRSRSSGPQVPLPIPEGVGNSPIDTIECADLSSLDTLRKALKCNVCQRTASKLGMIAECYRTHGIVRCALCFNTYVDKQSYSTHLKATHASGSKLKCPLCAKEFTNVGQTAGHMYNNHWLILLGPGPIARKGPRKFLANVIDLNQLGDGTNISGTGDEGENEADGENSLNISAATESSEGADGNTTNNDYSNITLGSLLESSINSAAATTTASAKSAADDIKSEGKPVLEGLLKGNEEKSENSNEVEGGTMEDEGEADDQLEIDEGESERKDLDEEMDQEEGQYEEGVEEEEDGQGDGDGDGGLDLNDDDDIEVYPGEEDDEEDQGN